MEDNYWNTDMGQAPRTQIIEVSGHIDTLTRKKRVAKAQWNSLHNLWVTTRGDVIFPDMWREV